MHPLLDKWGLLSPAKVTKQGDELETKINTRVAVLSATDLYIIYTQ